MKPCILESLRQKYPVGTRVELVSMDDVQAPPIGTKGTVRGVDDIGSILIQWDNGSTLNVVYGEDICRIVNPIKTICYGQTREWNSTEEAVKFFAECYINSEGSERERYFNILVKLRSGLNICTDD